MVTRLTLVLIISMHGIASGFVQTHSPTRLVNQRARFLAPALPPLWLANDQIAAIEPDKDPLQPERVAALMEKSFVEACMQLAQGFVDILKLFIVSTKAGYELETPPSDLVELVNNCPNQSAGRPLMKEEQDLREQWIHAVYLTLEFVKWKDIEPSWPTKDEIQSTFGPVLSDLVESKEKGQKLETERLLVDYPELLKDTTDVVERAIVAQTLRVIWITLEALQEEEMAKPRGPRPKIPGAFESD